MAVRAKFKVTGINLTGWGDKPLKTITLSPVSQGSPENKAFYEATPSGEMKIGTLNEEAGKQFELGDEFYIDFTKADKPIPA
mgnify:CR=1 FL=1